jgi:hypothetical protein
MRVRADFRELASLYHHGEIGLADVRQRVMSFLAYAKHCNARRTVEGSLADLVLVPGLHDIPEQIARRFPVPAGAANHGKLNTFSAFSGPHIPNLEYEWPKSKKG